MAEDQWTRVAKEEELAEGKPISVKVGKSAVLLVRRGDKIHACGGKCSHYGGPLAEGLLMGDVITCPWHAARFNVRNGHMVLPPGLDDVGCYAVKVEDGEVYVGEKEEAGPPEMAGEDERTFVIVGAGAAGNAAAETLRREGFAGRILLITGEPHRPYDRPTLSKELMSGEASAKWLALHKSGFYDDWQIELLTERRVASLDPEGHTLALADGEQIGFDCALLATGGVPRRLDIPGATLRAASSCAAGRTRRPSWVPWRTRRTSFSSAPASSASKWPRTCWSARGSRPSTSWPRRSCPCFACSAKTLPGGCSSCISSRASSSTWAPLRRNSAGTARWRMSSWPTGLRFRPTW